MKAAIPYALVLVIGGLSFAVWTEAATSIEKDERIKRLEADVRKFSGKFLDLQELVDEERGELHSSISMLQWRLESCSKGGK